MITETLQMFINAGFTLYPAYSSGSLPGSAEEVKCTYLTDLETWINKGFKRYHFKPIDTGLVILDLDKGHRDGEDGLLTWTEWVNGSGLLKKYPWLTLEKHPCQVTTPRGGAHLYFEAPTMENWHPLSNFINSSIDVRYRAFITAPGSEKETGTYELKGSLAAIPKLPLKVLNLLTQASPKPRKITIPGYSKGQYHFNKLLDFARADSNGGNHDTVFCMAKRLRNQGYTQEETENIIFSTEEAFKRTDETNQERIIKDTQRVITDVFKGGLK